MKSFQVQAGLWFVYLVAIATALTHPEQRPRYRVNTKVGRDINLLARTIVLLPNLALMGLSLVAIAYGVFHYSNRPSYLWVHVLWCGWTIFCLWRATAVGLWPELFERSPEPAAK